MNTEMVSSNWRSQLKGDPIPWLLEENQPEVRYLTLTELLAAGERGWNLKRAINIRMGLTGANDRLPKALLEPVPDGNSAGFIPDFAAMLESYYVARGWDPKSGKPSPERLNALGMTEISRDLWG